MDCDGSLDPRDLPVVVAPVLDRAVDLCMGARTPERGAWPLHARLANAALAAELRRRTGLPLSDLGPMRAARREELLGLGIRDRRFGWPLEMVIRAAAAGWRIGELPVPYGRASGTLEGHRDAARDGPSGPRHVRGAAVTGKLIVIAKSPRPGHCKTRLAPPLTLDGAARVARAALSDTLLTAVACPADEHVLALSGEPGPWIPAGFRTIAQRGNGLDDRLAATFADVGGPALLIGMDTPQITAALLAHGLRELSSPGTDAVIGPALDGGYWALGLREPAPELLHGVPMSRADTFARAGRPVARPRAVGQPLAGAAGRRPDR